MINDPVVIDDPVLDEVRRVRKLISKEIGPNLEDLVEHYAQYQSRFKRKPIELIGRKSSRIGQAMPDDGD